MKYEIFYKDHQTRLRLLEDYTFEVDGEIFTVENGFEFDGASIPKFFWRVEQPINAKYLEAFLEHDALYAHHWVGRKKADKHLYERLRALGMRLAKGQGDLSCCKAVWWQSLVSYSSSSSLCVQSQLKWFSALLSSSLVA